MMTQKQKSLADQRRREARKETPITLAEVDMNEKEMRECKSLVMCFLSGRGGDDDNGSTSREGKKSAAGKKRGCDDVATRYVESFQHDPGNYSVAYHYRSPPLGKKEKGVGGS